MNVQDWAQLTTNAVAESLTKIISYIPNILGAIVVLLVGVIVGWAVKTVIVKGLSYVKLQKYTDAIGLGKIFTQKVEFATLLGDLAKWTIIIIFLIPAFEILKLDQINEVIVGILSYLPSVFIAIISIFVGAIVADLVARIIKSTAGTIGVETADIVGEVARYAIIVFVVLGALQQLNILPQLISTLTIGVVAFFVIAGGVAFGLGGKDAAAGTLKAIADKMPKEKK
jgi:hypothetical protein